MAGRIFGARVFGPRIFGSVFGGSGTTDTVIGWVNAQWFDRPSGRSKLLPSFHVEQSNRLPWIQSAIITAARQFTGVGQHQRNQDYLLRARKRTPPQYGDWTGPRGWIQFAADAATINISGWRSGVNVRDFPPLSRRGVRHTLFDPGWITRNVPGVPLPNIAFWAGISPEKGGYPPLVRNKHPYLYYEYTPTKGWLWTSVILPIIFASAAAFMVQAQQEYPPLKRRITPYMQEWSAAQGWITQTLADILAASFPAVATLFQQEYTLRRQNIAPYMPEWSFEQGWINSAVQNIILLTFGAVDGLAKQGYTLANRARLQLLLYRWAAHEGWIMEPAFFNVLPTVAPQNAQMRSKELRRIANVSALTTIGMIVSHVPEPPEPGTKARRITTLGSVTNTGA